MSSFGLSSLFLAFSYLVYAHSVQVLEKPFVAVWNAQSATCKEEFNIVLNLTMFDIVTNKGQNFTGNNMVIFYEPKPGLYPFILSNGTGVNHCLPQLADLPKHFDQAKRDIMTVVKDSSFDGLSVIDWESWRPTFSRNSYSKEQQIYINKSIELARNQHPGWNRTQVYELAEAEFESSARSLMESTLLLGRQLRPSGYWGYYGFPRCYNQKFGQSHCSNDTVYYNDKLLWLFSASSALFPSIYLDDAIPSILDRKLRVEGILRESLRVHQNFADPYTPVYAYSRFRYSQSQKLYIKEDLINTIGQSFDAGMDGVVIWEGSKYFRTRSGCLSIQKYLDNFLGPMIKQTVYFARKCSLKLCYDHGKCINKYWHDNLPLERDRWNMSDYKCKCYRNWTGEHCDQPG